MEFKAILSWRDTANRRRSKPVTCEADTTQQAIERLETEYPYAFVSDIERIDNE